MATWRKEEKRPCWMFEKDVWVSDFLIFRETKRQVLRTLATRSKRKYVEGVNQIARPLREKKMHEYTSVYISQHSMFSVITASERICTTSKIHTTLHPSGVFSIFSPVRILMTSFPDIFHSCVCANSR